MEAQQADDAREKILVERDHGGKRTARLRIAQPQPMLTGGIGDDDMAPVDAGPIGEQRAECARIDRGGRLESIRCGVENDRDSGQFRTPDYRV